VYETRAKALYWDGRNQFGEQGASGIAEFLTVVLMKNLIKPDAVGLYALLTRFFTTYFAVAIGGTVLVSQLAKDLKQGKVK
jgi:uncharacterized membrane protein YbhN (UPF0104 family)